ncbi:MAG: SprT-like domain-containing protein [Bacilli bacterium]|nr:SprT-like domain-containing protein [Bacilli bacterium]
MTFEMEGNQIAVVIKRKNNKNVYIRFQEDDTLLVTCNSWVSLKKIERILEENRPSLVKMWKHHETIKAKERMFFYLGKPYEICFNEEYKSVEITSNKIYCKSPKQLELFYKKECLRVFESELNRIVPYFHNIPKFTLRIRKMKTRWGVNNLSSHTITLNSELLKKDLDLIDYVIIHELCHFYHQNHSKNFWDAVEMFYPKYKEARKRLRG